MNYFLQIYYVHLHISFIFILQFPLLLTLVPDGHISFLISTKLIYSWVRDKKEGYVGDRLGTGAFS